MNRAEIESNDRQLLTKVRTIVEEKKSTGGGPFRHLSRLWIPVLCIGLIAIGLTVFRQRPVSDASKNAEPVSGGAAEIDRTPALDTTSGKNRPADAEKISPDAEKSRAEDRLASVDRDAQPAMESPPETPPPAEALTDAGRSTATVGAAQVETFPSDPPPRKVRIREIVSCGGVIDRQYVSPGSTFSLSEVSTSVVWMNVFSDIQPFTLTHVYYLNGHHYCEVPLKISHPRMRTWSSVTLNGMDQMGDWRVDVVTDSGEVLEQIAFSVVP
jgi:hypothetical protein